LIGWKDLEINRDGETDNKIRGGELGGTKERFHADWKSGMRYIGETGEGKPNR
jgi:hypothetical protein